MKSKVRLAIRMIAGSVTAGVTAAGLILATIPNQGESKAIQLEHEAPAVLQSNVIPEVEMIVNEVEEMMLTAGNKNIGNVLAMQGNVFEETEPATEDLSEATEVYEIALHSEAEPTPLGLYFSDKAIVNGELVESYLNMRSTPEDSSTDNICAAIGTDQIFEVLNLQDDWTSVYYDGISGWVKSDFILTGEDAASYVEMTADPYAEVTAANMNIRMGKSITSGILDVAYQGEAYPLISMEDGWAYVELGDILKGYLAGNCITINYVWNDLIIATKTAGATDDQVINLEANPQQGGFLLPPEASMAPVVPVPDGSASEPSTAVPPATETPVQTPVVPPVTEAPAETPVAPPATEAPAETPVAPPATEAPAEIPVAPPVTEAPAEVPTAPPATEAPTEAPVTITAIEGFYIGTNQKVEGEVMHRAEICIYVSYSDGSLKMITEGWTSDDIGMILHAGTEVITVHYGGLSSNIVLEVLPAPTEAPTAPPATEAPAAPPVTEAPTVPPATEAPIAPPVTEAPTAPPATEAPTAPPATEAPAQDTAYVNNVTLSGELTAYALKLCSQYGVDSSVIFSVMYQESKFNPNAVSGSGAIGLMQIIPRYSQERMNRLGVTDLYDPKSNMLVGIDLLAEYYYTYGSWVAALTQYRYGTTNASGDYANLILSKTSMFQ